MTQAAEPGLRMGSPEGRWVLFTTVLGSGLVLLDATVVNVALARIGDDFGTGFAGLQWTVNAYTLTLASLILLGGSLGDRFGRRRVFVVGVLWFAVASLLCGLAPSIETLVVARGLQGIGGALLTPGSLALISATFHGQDRAAAVGAWSGLGGVAAAVGPFLGGWLVEWSWRSVFLINVPLAAVIIVVALRHVPESRDELAADRFDVVGTLLAVVGLSALTYGLTAAGESTFGDLPVVTCIGLGVAGLAAFVWVERRSTHPLVPPVLFRSPQFNAANVVTFLVYAALGVLFVLLVLHLQVVADFPPVLAGTALLPVTVILLLLSSSAGRLAQQIGPRLLMTAGPLLSAGGVLWLTGIGPDASYLGDVLPPVVVFATGLALVVAPLTATVLDSAADRYAGVASGVNNAVARAAGLLAVAVVPVAAGLDGDDYTEPTVFADGFERAMIASALLLATGALVAFLLIRRPLGLDENTPDTGVDDPAAPRLSIESCQHCGVTGPQLHPRPPPTTRRAE